MKVTIKSLVTENFSYKLVSLFIALILWLTILGRRDFALTRSIDVELVPAAGYSVSLQSASTVRVKLTGPQTALKKFVDSGMSQLISIDVSKKGPGDIDVEIPVRQIDVPFGVRVISVKPTTIRATVIPKGE